MNYKSIPWFPRTWKFFLDHSQPEQALCLKPVASFPILSALAFSFFLCLWTNRFAILLQYLSNLELDFFALLLPSPIMRIWNLNWIDLPPGREITVYPSRFAIHDQNSRDCRKDRKATRWKAQKRKKKPKLIKLEKMQRDLRQSACLGWLWSKKSFQVWGNQAIDL